MTYQTTDRIYVGGHSRSPYRQSSARLVNRAHQEYLKARMDAVSALRLIERIELENPVILDDVYSPNQYGPIDAVVATDFMDYSHATPPAIPNDIQPAKPAPPSKISGPASPEWNKTLKAAAKRVSNHYLKDPDMALGWLWVGDKGKHLGAEFNPKSLSDQLRGAMERKFRDFHKQMASTGSLVKNLDRGAICVQQHGRRLRNYANQNIRDGQSRIAKGKAQKLRAEDLRQKATRGGGPFTSSKGKTKTLPKKQLEAIASQLEDYGNQNIKDGERQRGKGRVQLTGANATLAIGKEFQKQVKNLGPNLSLHAGGAIGNAIFDCLKYGPPRSLGNATDVALTVAKDTVVGAVTSSLVQVADAGAKVLVKDGLSAIGADRISDLMNVYDIPVVPTLLFGYDAVSIAYSEESKAVAAQKISGKALGLFVRYKVAAIIIAGASTGGVSLGLVLVAGIASSLAGRATEGVWSTAFSEPLPDTAASEAAINAQINQLTIRQRQPETD